MRSAVANRILDSTHPSVRLEVKEHSDRLAMKANADMVCEFLDLEKCTDPFHIGQYTCWYIPWEGKYVLAKEMLFASSWAWLMPAVQKINSLHTASIQDRCWNTKVKELWGHVQYVELDLAYKAVIEFIKWHNSI